MIDILFYAISLFFAFLSGLIFSLICVAAFIKHNDRHNESSDKMKEWGRRLP